MHDHNHQCACGHHQGEDGCCHEEENSGITPLTPLTLRGEEKLGPDIEKHECVCGGHCGCCEEEPTSP